MRRKSKPTLFYTLTSIWCLLAATLTIYLWFFTSTIPYDNIQNPQLALKKSSRNPKFYTLKHLDGTQQTFSLVDPSCAPPHQKEKVLKGYRIMHQTYKHAKEFVGNQMSCCNCHTNGGNTFGGFNGGIPLVGVTKWYPSFSQREQRIINLQERINHCFERSMNGKKLPFDHPTMEALIAYLTWISQPVEHLSKHPWRKLLPLQVHTQPSAKRGKQLFEVYCSCCHKTDGKGLFLLSKTLRVPPLWGPESFNDGAGMNRMPLLSSFIYHNMPYHEPCLTAQQAQDIAAYIILQRRPQYQTPSPQIRLLSK